MGKYFASSSEVYQLGLLWTLRQTGANMQATGAGKWCSYGTSPAEAWLESGSAVTTGRKTDGRGFDVYQRQKKDGKNNSNSVRWGRA